MVEFLDKELKGKIVDAIRRAERWTSGEIRVHLRSRCPEDVLKKARETFTRLGMHRTKERNGVLIFVAPKSRRFAIVGDEAIDRKVGDSFWNETRDVMSGHFSKGELAEGIVEGVRKAGEQLKKYFPGSSANANELPDTVEED